MGEIKKDLGKGAEVMLLRALIVVFIVLSVVLAQQKWQLIVNLMAPSWGLVAGCFLGPFVWGLYWPRPRRGPPSTAVWRRGRRGITTFLRGPAPIAPRGMSSCCAECTRGRG